MTDPAEERRKPSFMKFLKCPKCGEIGRIRTFDHRSGDNNYPSLVECECGYRSTSHLLANVMLWDALKESKKARGPAH